MNFLGVKKKGKEKGGGFRGLWTFRKKNVGRTLFDILDPLFVIMVQGVFLLNSFVVLDIVEKKFFFLFIFQIIIIIKK